jgi:hypothetical protein
MPFSMSEGQITPFHGKTHLKPLSGPESTLKAALSRPWIGKKSLMRSWGKHIRENSDGKLTCLQCRLHGTTEDGRKLFIDYVLSSTWRTIAVSHWRRTRTGPNGCRLILRFSCCHAFPSNRQAVTSTRCSFIGTPSCEYRYIYRVQCMLIDVFLFRVTF